MSSEAGTPKRGVFWVADNALLAFPFDAGAHASAIAKSGSTYNHRMLWAEIGSGGRPYNYHPRGRVDVTRSGAARIYVSPRIDLGKWLPEIRATFGIGRNDLKVIEDYSAHYRCHLDDGWAPDR